MKKKLISMIFMFFVVLNIQCLNAKDTFSGTISYSRNSILYVGGTGPGNYTLIQDAIDNASDGDTIFVFDEGSPYHELLILNKAIQLIGENKNTTIIDANYTGTPVNITHDNCQILNFTIKNCNMHGWYWEFSAIKIFKSNSVTVKNNIITLGANVVKGFGTAALNLHSSSNNIIENNYIFENHSSSSKSCSGIVLHEGSSHNLIAHNQITEYDIGIYSVQCNKNIMSDNYIHKNEIGILLENSRNNDILNNMIIYNEDFGINFISSRFNQVLQNNISYNGGTGCYGEFECGMLLDYDGYHYFSGSNYNIISGNIISRNNATGIIVFDSYHNFITKNNFINNFGGGGYPQRWWGNAFFDFIAIRFICLFHANTWNLNYWSDYTYEGQFPKIIRGALELFLSEFPIIWITFDWHPAQEPYDIPGMT